MTRPIGHTTDLAADVETAYAALTSRAWAQRKAERLADDSTVVADRPDAAGGATFAVSRRLPEGGPGFLRRFLPADGRVVQTDTWQPAAAGARDGKWALTAAGVPATVGGTLRLEPVGAGCRYVLAGTVSVGVPLIGGKAESALVDMLGQLLASEGELLADLVAEQRA